MKKDVFHQLELRGLSWVVGKCFGTHRSHDCQFFFGTGLAHE